VLFPGSALSPAFDKFRTRKFLVTFKKSLPGIECPVVFGPLGLALPTELDPVGVRDLPNDPLWLITASSSSLSFSRRRPVYSVRRRCFFIWYFCAHLVGVEVSVVVDSIAEQNLCRSPVVTAGPESLGAKAATKRILIAGS
jgi:hypothetical protein